MAKDVLGAGFDSVGSAFDSSVWKEYFVSGDMSDGILMKRAEKVTGAKSRNTRSDDNLISSGSGIDVQESQCMIIVDNGKIIEFCAEPGRYTFDASTSPSLFSGDNKGLKAFGKEILNQWSVGGQRNSTQRVYFINLGEMIYSPIKWGCGNIAFHHTTMMKNGAPPIELDITLRGNGELTIMITDPVKFFKMIGAQKVGGDNDGVVSLNDDGISGHLKSCIIDKIGEAISSISYNQSIPYTALGTVRSQIADQINNLMSTEWVGTRGFGVCSFTINGSLQPIEEDKEKIQNMQQSFTMGANVNAAIYDIQKGYSEGARAAGSNPNGAMNGFMGVGMGGMASGFASGMGQMQPTQLSGNPPAQPQYQPQNPVNPVSGGGISGAAVGGVAAADGNTWTCKCGKVNSDMFCSKCGAKKPEPPASTEWTCSCGKVNTDMFCSRCGSKKPVERRIKCDKCGWEATDDGTELRFCPKCGDIINSADEQ